MDEVFGLNEMDDEDGALSGEDGVGNLDADDDLVYNIDVPSDSEVSDELENESSDEESPDDDEQEESQTIAKTEGWGKSRRAFYSADDTFADDEAAKLEEVEAEKLKRKRLTALKESDFLDGAFATLTDSSSFAGTQTPSAVNQAEPFEVLEKRPAESMTRDEILEYLASVSPDLLEFIIEFQSGMEDLRDGVQPLYLLALKLEPEESPVRQYLSAKYFSLLGFLVNVSYYFCLYSQGKSRNELENHPVIEVLLHHKQSLQSIKEIEEQKPWLVGRLEPLIVAVEEMEELAMSIDEYVNHVFSEVGEQSGQDASVDGSDVDMSPEGDESQSDDEALELQASSQSARKNLPKPAVRKSNDVGRLSKKAKVALSKVKYEDDYQPFSGKLESSKTLNDFNDNLDDANIGLKAPPISEFLPGKKSLRKIVRGVQSANKTKAFTSLDADVRRKEKKQNTLNVHLSKEEVESAERDADVFSDDDHAVSSIAKKTKHTNVLNGLNLDMVDPSRPISSLRQQREEKLRKRRRGAEEDGSFEETHAMGDSKRVASYTILKNRGLTPHRKKEDRNPRLKHRRKFEKKVKKLKTVKRLATDLKRGYHGELTGIKTHLTRSIKLQ
jgi:hypothetical protein